MNGEEVVIGTAMLLIGENSRTVAQRVSQRLREVVKSLPDGIVTQTVYDRTALVEATIATVEKNLIEGRSSSLPFCFCCSVTFGPPL